LRLIKFGIKSLFYYTASHPPNGEAGKLQIANFMLVQKTLAIQMLLDTDTDTGALGSASFLPFIRFVVWYLSFFF